MTVLSTIANKHENVVSPIFFWRVALMRAVRRRTGNSKDDPQYLEKIADRCVSEAAKGEMAAIREIGGRLDGKAAQSLQLAGDPESPVVFNMRSILHAINIDSTGKALGVQPFWTGTKADGTTASIIVTCTGWKDPLPYHHGMHGQTNMTNSSWSTMHPMHSCRIGFFPLLCFQQ